MEVLIIIGVVAIVYIVFRIVKGFSDRKKFETVIHHGEKTTLNKIFVQIGHELAVPTHLLLKISVSLFHASIEIREEHKKTNMPYDAIIAYFAAGVCTALHEFVFAAAFKEYGDSIGMTQSGYGY